MTLESISFLFAIVIFLITRIPVGSPPPPATPSPVTPSQSYFSSSPASQTTSTPSPTPPTPTISSLSNRIINNTVITDTLTEKGEEQTYTYIPEISGTYRFDFGINDTTENYHFSIADENNTQLAYTQYSSSGSTVELVAGETYTIIVSTYSNYVPVKYTVNIGVPNKQEPVIDNTISGNLTYKDQENVYSFTASNSGIYRFDFDINDTTKNYHFTITDASNTQLAYTQYSSSGSTVELSAGNTYTITVSTYSNYVPVDYTISIGVPNNQENIVGNSISGTLTYRDQENIYNFTATNGGTYRFDFDISDTTKTYRFAIYDAKNTQLASTTYDNGGSTVELVADGTYVIIVSTYSNYVPVNYTISIGVPGSQENVTGSSVSGELTYRDQKDIYSFTATNSGNYRFDFDIDDTTKTYRFAIYDAKNTQLASTTYDNKKSTVALVAGETYTIVVSTYSNYVPVNYIITINSP